MEYTSDASSKEELLQLRNDGKISEAEYQELLELMNKPASDNAEPSAVAEPQFEAFRIRLLTGSLVLCAVGLSIGLILELPYVWGLGIFGMIFIPIKLSRIKGSWVARLVNKYK
jgi:hypothetical protein